MENVGCVSLNEDLLYYSEDLTVDKKQAAYLTMLHELAHHWFGNLVTMKWWNDLWLNESFADFISFFCLTKFKVKSKTIQNIWLSFNARKGWGYRAD